MRARAPKRIRQSTGERPGTAGAGAGGAEAGLSSEEDEAGEDEESGVATVLMTITMPGITH
ncbi:hypothetical protein GCM10010359_00270 [Streptomyces morookaense]|nr:hypothetical protein GCM10010359_00270 [Streptomyces morookaense]